MGYRARHRTLSRVCRCRRGAALHEDEQLSQEEVITIDLTDTVQIVERPETIALEGWEMFDHIPDIGRRQVRRRLESRSSQERRMKCVELFTIERRRHNRKCAAISSVPPARIVLSLGAR